MEVDMESRKQFHGVGADEVPTDSDAGDDVALTPKQYTRNVWGVLTAISDKAKSRPQGPQIFLHDSEHVLGRLAKDPSCRFDSLNVSAKHCTIFRKRFKAETNLHTGERWLVYIKDSSSNGTFINFQKLKRDSPEARLSDGDIISLVNPPEHDNAFTYLYQEIKPHVEASQLGNPQGTILNVSKRKTLYDDEVAGEPYLGDTKRAKGTVSDDQVSLFGFGQLQKSNENLRDQLKENLLIIEKLRSESTAVKELHDADLKELRESLSAAFMEQIKELQIQLVKKEKELERLTSMSVLHNSQLEDRNRALAATIQSLKDSEEVIKRQSACLFKLKVQLEEEKSFRHSDKMKAEAKLKAAVEKLQREASEVLKHHMESYANQLKQQSETIEALQESNKQNHSLIGALRMDLEEARSSLVKAEHGCHSLELRLQDVQSSLGNASKEISQMELKLQAAVNKVQNEKVAKEEALSRLSVMEMKMQKAISEISSEKKWLHDAQNRIALRESQIRELFCSTSEDIALIQKKQEQYLSLIIRVLQNGSNGSIQVNDRVNAAAQTYCNDRVKTSELEVDTMNADGQQEAPNGHVDVQDNAGENDTSVKKDNQISKEYDQEISASDVHEKKLKFSNPHVAEQECTQLLKTENQCYVETQALDNGIEMIPDTLEIRNLGSGMNMSKHFQNEFNYHVGDTIMVDTTMQTQLVNQDTDMFDKDRELKLKKSPDRVQNHTHYVGDSNTQINSNAPMNTHDLMTSEVAGSWLFNTSASVHADNVGAIEPCRYLDGNGPDQNSSGSSPHENLDETVQDRHSDGTSPHENLDETVQDRHSDGTSPHENLDKTVKDRHSDGTSPDRHSNGTSQDRHLDGTNPERNSNRIVQHRHLDVTTHSDGTSLNRNSNVSSPDRHTNQDRHSLGTSPDRHSEETDQDLHLNEVSQLAYFNFDTAFRNRAMPPAFDDEEHTLGGDEGCPVMELDGQAPSLPLL